MFMDPVGSSRLLQKSPKSKIIQEFCKNPKKQKSKKTKIQKTKIQKRKGKSWTSWPSPGSQGPPRFPNIFLRILKIQENPRK
jgi:hypothetical protein